MNTNNSAYNQGTCCLPGDIIGASGLRGNDGNKESSAHACSQLPSAIAHVFIEVYLSVSAPVLSGTRLPRFPDQGRSFGRLFSRSFPLFALLTLFLCIIVAKSVSLATHWQYYVRSV